ncbi:MAG: membrane protein insertase YidC, partial [Limnobacter sp.]|nr:membrane protein insertase YidC [Limnobacter sp.]
MIFSFSCLMLWDNYQISQGRPGVLGFGKPPVAQTDNHLVPGTDNTQGSAGGASAVQPINDLPQAPSAPVVSANASESGLQGLVGAGVASGDLLPTEQPKLVTVKTDILELTFSTQGAQLVGSRLLGHPAVGKVDQPVQLFEQSANRTYLGQAGVVGVPGAPNHRSPFEFVSGQTEFAQGQDALNLVFSSTQNGIEVVYTYTVYKNSYEISFKAQVNNQSGQVLANPSVYLQITRDEAPLPGDSKLYSTFTGPAIYTPETSTRKLNFQTLQTNLLSTKKYRKVAGWRWFSIILCLLWCRRPGLEPITPAR